MSRSVPVASHTCTTHDPDCFRCDLSRDESGRTDDLRPDGACAGPCFYGTCNGGPAPCGGCCSCMGGCTVQYENQQQPAPEKADAMAHALLHNEHATRPNQHDQAVAAGDTDCPLEKADLGGPDD